MALLLEAIRTNWAAHEFYHQALEVRRDSYGGLGVFFKTKWPRGLELGSPEISHAIATRFAKHDGHSVAERPDRTAKYGRPVNFVGLASILNHGCMAHAHFGQPSNWYAPWVAKRVGYTGEQALVYYGPGQEYTCPKCGAAT